MIIKRYSQKKIIKPQIQEELPAESAAPVQPEPVVEQQQAVQQEQEKQEDTSDIFAGFNFDEIDFNQGAERRRGDRRRGYRRIDDRNLISRAQQEAINIKEQASKEGFEKGLEEAHSAVNDLKDSLEEFFEYKDRLYEKISGDILDISLKVAEKIIKKEVETDPQVLINTIVDVLRTVSKSEPKINIRVKPQAVQFIKDTLPNITYQYGIDAKINIVADPSIEEGGCVFQTNNGIVDASIDTQLEIIKKALEGM